MTTVSYCYILESFYEDYPNLVQILDIGDSSKHNIRTHICLQINYNGNNILIPLRKSLGDPIRKFGKIGFPVPSNTKPNAGYLNNVLLKTIIIQLKKKLLNI